MTARLDFWLLLFVLFCQHLAKAQNIVPNGNLEDVNICTEFHAPCSPSAWFTVKKYVPGGYYHQYPDRAASGKQYFDLFVVINGGSRQYWQTMLLCKLVPGQKYTASVKVAAGEVGPNLYDIGFYFTDHFIFAARDTLLQPPVYLGFLDATIKKLDHNWFQLTKEFTAISGESCLVIGNFSPEDNRSILKKRHNGNLINLMIDDIVITPQQADVCPEYTQKKDSLYAIKKRHSGDTILSIMSMTDTTATTTIPDTAATVKENRIDTLQLSNVLFEFDRFVLIHPDTLEKFRSVLINPAIKKIEIAGYTDDAGSTAYNAVLSDKRAKEIARLIAERFYIPANVIHAEGKGISTFYIDKSKNRRVDIYVYY